MMEEIPNLPSFSPMATNLSSKRHESLDFDGNRTDVTYHWYYPNGYWSGAERVIPKLMRLTAGGSLNWVLFPVLTKPWID